MYSIDSTHERRLLWLLALTQFTIIMDFMVMMPLGPQIMHSFAITPAAFATAVSAYSWCSGLSGLFAATYIDRFDRRRLLLAVYALFALSNLACALANSFHLLLAARAFAGITGGVLASVIMAIVADVIPVQRRGAATGTIMTAFSLAAIAGVPAGVMLGAHFGWAAPFLLLVALSGAIWLAGWQLVPSLAAHLGARQPPLAEVLPELMRLLGNPRHMAAFALTFVMMVAHMLIIPFIAPVLVANHGVAPEQLSWLYMAGGAATFFTSRRVGKLADRFGARRVFRIAALFACLPVLFITHLPHVPFYALLLFFPLFMVLMSGRMVPMQALLTTVPQPERRGAFLSANSALQALGTGCGAWIGGLMLGNSSAGQIVGYGTVGWVSVAVALAGVLWVSRVRSAQAPQGQAPTPPVLRSDAVVGEG
ncbi:MFS transporter [bacterium M00.F.Ca.ET.228.01.1.1]|uniref:MFS transporter n=1 Tax=Paraburkholderia phenoliruptrix TaxID=252970 RepID=UPI0010918A63|nr:MFS transporter [Paraburkholderia phenoliruptrix]TGP48093.1 MFS transporter [bacterium M00.F.Ca.ET.228.01.1.1]TGS05885.1 MFS transporter [bacterium M00.F.Ca.ET.191.01.1.1]TGU10822.1 MFS transporter [bacterium M00.F.Ca.ET.155.01.1.1]MBW0445080.1 MFS transporter [Paraburkholderia phenoliruptrix]MBW9095845.1 MFS transporter [Paraburkholderia phenoliruptrix]